MFKSIGNTFKRNLRIEKAMTLAGTAFGIHPRSLSKQMPFGMKQDWRKELMDTAQSLNFNEHELAASMVIGFIGLIQDQHHKTAIETVMLDWLDKDLIRPEIYEHYRDERNNTM